jgi:hypothetical protein
MRVTLRDVLAGFKLTVAWAWKFFIGIIVTLIVFYGNFIDFKQPNVSVEITEIDQNTSPDVDISSSPMFPKTRELVGDDIMVRIRGSKIEDIEKAISSKEQAMADQLVENQNLREISSSPEAITANHDQIIRMLNGSDMADLLSGRSLVPEDELTPAKVQEEVAKRENDRKYKSKLIDSARQELKTFSDNAKNQEARINLTAAVSNSGDGTTTLKPQALLRTDLGENNYLDIQLKIKDYDNGKADLKARSASVIELQSDPIKDMSPEDRQRFIDFFKNTSPTRLYVTDVRGHFYRSNVIPFAQGIYEQRIYDSLKAFASKD